MAKKKEIVRLRVICEEGEECWVEYPAFLYSERGVNLAKPKGWPATWAIRRRGDFCYVQGEDAHTMIEVQLENNGLAPRYTQHDVANFRAWLASAHWPTALDTEGE